MFDLVILPQATAGSCRSAKVPRPSFFDFVGKAKWDAWNSLGDMPQSEAKKLYVEFVDSVLPKTDDPNAPDTTGPCQLPKDSWLVFSKMADSEDSWSKYEKKANYLCTYRGQSHF